MVPPVPIRTSFFNPSLGSLGGTSFFLSEGRSVTRTSESPYILTPMLYPLFSFRTSMSGELKSWWGIMVPSYLRPLEMTVSLQPSDASADARSLDNDSE